MTVRHHASRSINGSATWAADLSANQLLPQFLLNDFGVGLPLLSFITAPMSRPLKFQAPLADEEAEDE